MPWVVLILFACPASSVAQEAIPLAVRDGRCSCVIPASRSDERYLLNVGSVAMTPGPFHVTVTTEAADAPISLPDASDDPGPEWKRRIAELRGRLERARQAGAPLDEFPPLAHPQQERTFHLFVGERDLQDPSGYVAVVGGLQAVGRYCQVYVDRDRPDSPALRAVVEDIVHTFDSEVFPQSRRLGQVVDVDRDGRFTILLTPWLGKLGGGKVALGGFVRGSDFYRDLASPLGNRCDLMFLNADLEPGPHLHVLLAHEYTHAVAFSEHVFGNYLPEQPHVEEEAWLNEGLAHLAEVRHGWSNIDHRIAAFLEAPQKYQLVVPDYFGAGLWRSAGHRGATFLFLRSCVDRHGDDLPARLIRSNLTGVANLEAATGEPFARSFREWTVATALKSANPEDRAIERRGPRLIEVPLRGGTWTDSLAGTSAAYLALSSTGGGHSQLTVTADPAAELQVTLVRVAKENATPRTASPASP